MNDDSTEARERVEENFPWAEWDIIEDTVDGASGIIAALSWENVHEAALSEKPTRRNDDDDTSNAEEANEREDGVETQSLETSCEDSSFRREDESDGVSVISESDREERESIEEAESGVVVYAPATDRSAGRNNGKEVVTGRYCLLIGCCVLVAIGAGLAYRLRVVDTFSNSEDRSSTRMRRLEECAKEFDSAEKILETIRSSVTKKRIADSNEMTGNGRPLESPSTKQTDKMDSGFRAPEAAILDRLQIFLHSLCLVLDDDAIRTANIDLSRSLICGDPRTFFSDLASLRKMLDGAIEEMGEPIESANRKFLGKMDSRIAAMRDSFVADLTGSLMKLRSKNEKKLEKINRGMRERLCVLRNTMPSDSQIRRSLEADTTLLTNCNETMSKKFERKTEKWARKPLSEKNSNVLPRSNSTDSFRSNGQNCTTCEKNSQNVWRAAEKRCSDQRTDIALESPGNSCSRFSIPIDRAANEKIARQESRAEKILPSRASKKKTDDRDRINRKRSNSPLNGKMKNMEKTILPKVHARTSSESSDENSYVERNERSYRTKSASQYRAKVWPDEARREMKKEDIRANGQWQFARSQIRDQLRRDESTDNWYFDRVRNRKNSRMNVNDDIKQQR